MAGAGDMMNGFLTSVNEEETMSSKNLPEVLIVDILSRLPIESLLRFKCVCKLWCALIIDPFFVKMHLTRSLSTHSNLSLIFQNNNIYHLSIVDLDTYQQQKAVKLVHPLKSHPCENEIVGSCNGLLCIYDGELFLWNPSIRRHQKLPEHQKIPVRPISGDNNYNMYLGLGYDPTTDDYKLVCIMSGVVQVYSLSTNSWRRVGDMPFKLYKSSIPGVLANSALHWEGFGTASCFIIVSFDLKDEEFREVPLPALVEDDEFQMHMAIRVLGEQLCLQCTVSDICDEFWVMKDHGVRDSWTKLFSITQPLVINDFLPLRPICYSKNGEVILEQDDEYLVSFDPREGTSRKLRIRGVENNFFTIPYVGSLVPLNDKDVAKRTKRKKHCKRWN